MKKLTLIPACIGLILSATAIADNYEPAKVEENLQTDFRGTIRLPELEKNFSILKTNAETINKNSDKIKSLFSLFDSESFKKNTEILTNIAPKVEQISKDLQGVTIKEIADKVNRLTLPKSGNIDLNQISINTSQSKTNSDNIANQSKSISINAGQLKQLGIVQDKTYNVGQIEINKSVIATHSEKLEKIDLGDQKSVNLNNLVNQAQGNADKLNKIDLGDKEKVNLSDLINHTDDNATKLGKIDLGGQDDIKLGDINTKLGKITIGDQNIDLDAMNSKLSKITIGDQEINLESINSKLEKITIGNDAIDLNELNNKLGKIDLGGQDNIKLGDMSTKLGKITTDDQEINLSDINTKLDKINLDGLETVNLNQINTNKTNIETNTGSINSNKDNIDTITNEIASLSSSLYGSLQIPISYELKGIGDDKRANAKILIDEINKAHADHPNKKVYIVVPSGPYSFTNQDGGLGLYVPRGITLIGEGKSTQFRVDLFHKYNVDIYGKGHAGIVLEPGSGLKNLSIILAKDGISPVTDYFAGTTIKVLELDPDKDPDTYTTPSPTILDSIDISYGGDISAQPAYKYGAVIYMRTGNLQVNRLKLHKMNSKEPATAFIVDYDDASHNGVYKRSFLNIKNSYLDLSYNKIDMSTELGNLNIDNTAIMYRTVDNAIVSHKPHRGANPILHCTNSVNMFSKEIYYVNEDCSRGARVN